MATSSRILIVDDNLSVCKSMAIVLSHKGYSVTTASSGSEAIEMIRDKPFDIIFLDIKMPLMDGVETFKRIKRISPEATVVMMTAYAVEDLVEQAVQEGAHAVLYKPIDIEEVVRLIESATESNQGGLILLVDDDPSICVTMESILTKKGYQVDIAHTGEQAVAMSQEARFDIIFIDLKLPTFNGLETYLAVKKADPGVVAIMMTGYRQEMADLIKQALNSSAYGCLHKPLDMGEVLQLVREIIKRKQANSATQAQE